MEQFPVHIVHFQVAYSVSVLFAVSMVYAVESALFFLVTFLRAP